MSLCLNFQKKINKTGSKPFPKQNKVKAFPMQHKINYVCRVLLGGDHGHGRGLEVELGEIGHGGEGQADVQHLAAGGQEAQF